MSRKTYTTVQDLAVLIVSGRLMSLDIMLANVKGRPLLERLGLGVEPAI